MTTPQAVITDTSNTFSVARDLAFEIAAVSAAILDKEEEKTRTAQNFTRDIKKLKKRQRELITEIRTGGNAQLAMNFGSRIKEEIALASTAPDDGDDDRDDQTEPPDPNTEEPTSDDPEADDEAETFGATH